MPHEQHNIVIGGEEVGTRRNGVNAEKTTFFYNFLTVSHGLLSTIIAGGRLAVDPTLNINWQLCSFMAHFYYIG